jgi:hypothetical protein
MSLLDSPRRALVAALLLLVVLASCTPTPKRPVETEAPSADTGQAESSAQPSVDVAPAPAPEPAPTTTSTDPIVRIRDEGLNRSQVMQTLSYLTDVIGPRLTGSPNLRRANKWTAEKLTGWGLINAHEEAWGPFGRGWTLKRFSAQIVEPQTIPLIAYPKAWSPGFDQPLTAPVIYLEAKTEADFDKYRGKLKGAIVLTSPMRETAAHFEPLGLRLDDAELLKLANADAATLPFPGTSPRAQQTPDRKELLTPTSRPTTRAAATTRSTGQASTSPSLPAPPGSPRAQAFDRRLNEFLTKEGAALLVNISFRGDGGTLFVAQASGPTPPPPSSRGATQPTTPPSSQPTTRQVWALDPPPILPQITLSAEHYNRLVRMIQQGEHPKMTVDLQVQFHAADPMAYNTVAEIPGSDLKDQIIMLGAHMDSWHSGTGATDNGAGVASVMEAVRILQALKLQPRRTIRIALWTGEEQGLFGSKAYVAKHFGEFEPTTQPSARGGGGGVRGGGARPTTGPTSRPARKLNRQDEYERLSAYFNLDNGTGKIRGVYLQGNEAVRPLFRKWLAPFADLGAQTLTLSNTGGTDHIPFDAIGLPAFQFIQDPIEYWARTHHSNQDLYDRIQADDLKQASTILAAFIYDAAMMDEKLPRKALRAE